MLNAVALVVGVGLMVDTMRRQSGKAGMPYPARAALGVALAACGCLIAGSVVAAAELVAGAERGGAVVPPGPTGRAWGVLLVDMLVQAADIAVALTAALVTCQTAYGLVRWLLRLV